MLAATGGSIPVPGNPAEVNPWATPGIFDCSMYPPVKTRIISLLEYPMFRRKSPSWNGRMEFTYISSWYIDSAVVAM